MSDSYNSLRFVDRFKIITRMRFDNVRKYSIRSEIQSSMFLENNDGVVKV